MCKNFYFLQYSNRAKALRVISCNIYWARVQLVQKHNGYEYSSGERCIMDEKFLMEGFDIPVTWLLIDGLFCLIRSASMIWRRKGSLFVYMIFVLLTRISLVSMVPWAVSRCDLGPPEARCIVSLRDKQYMCSEGVLSLLYYKWTHISDWCISMGGGVSRSGIIAQY